MKTIKSLLFTLFILLSCIVVVAATGPGDINGRRNHRHTKTPASSTQTATLTETFTETPTPTPEPTESLAPIDPSVYKIPRPTRCFGVRCPDPNVTLLPPSFCSTAANGRPLACTPIPTETPTEEPTPTLGPTWDPAIDCFLDCFITETPTPQE